MQPAVEATASTITPDWSWRHDDTPYVGGDPINYLKFAREMRNFYAAHVREPMFPAATKVGLMLTGDADVGISLTSIAFGLLTLVATYALGALGRIADGRVGRRSHAGYRSQRRVLGDRRLARRALRLLRRVVCVGVDAVLAQPHARECHSCRRAQRRRMPDANHDDRAHRACSDLAPGDERARTYAGRSRSRWASLRSSSRRF